MNSLSYACPELLAGEDGLSDAARAKKLLLVKDSKSRFLSLGSGTGLKDHTKVDAVYVGRRCELSVAETMCEDKVRPEDDKLCKGDICEVHRRCCRQSWICGKCSAKLRDRRDCIEWEDGYCGSCGELNQRKLDTWTLKAERLVIENHGKVRETWPRLVEWRARAYAAITSLGIVPTGIV